MWCSILLTNTLLSQLLLPLVNAAACPGLTNLHNRLGESLSPGTSISNTIVDAPRWSEYGAPSPAYVINVTTEKDVTTIISYCNTYNITFLVQSGGNGWANTFRLGSCGILINIAGLNTITFNPQKTLARVQGGALTENLIEAAYGNDTRVANPTCTCLGYLGFALGGGINRAQGLYGMGVDQIVSVDVVNASGHALHVDEKHLPDLWYALRGAGANFGIVTSAVVRAYPTPQAQNVAWQAITTFSDDKLEGLVQSIQDLDLAPQMQIDLLFSTSGPPLYKSSISTIAIYFGNSSAAEEAFAPILKLGTTSNETRLIPYNHWGDWGAAFCIKGGRKPAYGASIARQGLVPATWRAVYEEYKRFVTSNPAAANSSVLAEYYPVEKAVALGGATSSYPFRDVPVHIAVIPQYASSSLDTVANVFGARVRELLYSTDGLVHNSTYVNFAHGDEPLDVVYGESLGRLQNLKRQYDPNNRFNQWFDLT